MKSYCDPEFWRLYNKLPPQVRKLADKNYSLWIANRWHRSVNFELIDRNERVWSARVGDHYRALCTKEGDDFVWFWIGTHEEYNGLI